jgi:hypothetical protein
MPTESTAAPARPAPDRTVGLVLASLFVPLVGIVVGVWMLLRERVGPGLALIFVGILCGGLWTGVYFVAHASGGGHAAAVEREPPVDQVEAGEREEAAEARQRKGAEEREQREAPSCKKYETTPANGCKE